MSKSNHKCPKCKTLAQERPIEGRYYCVPCGKHWDDMSAMSILEFKVIPLVGFVCFIIYVAYLIGWLEGTFLQGPPEALHNFLAGILDSIFFN